MFSTYNLNFFPIVEVLINGLPQNNEFDEFLQNWLQLYDRNQNFILLFDIRNIGDINIKYCFKMSLFIRSIRKQNPQYLQKSIILINNDKIKRLLDLIFTLQSPVADVFIINTEESINDIKLKIDTITIDNTDENIIYIEPNKSLLPWM
jgi:hypothetical protein